MQGGYLQTTKVLSFRKHKPPFGDHLAPFGAYILSFGGYGVPRHTGKRVLFAPTWYSPDGGINVYSFEEENWYPPNSYTKVRAMVQFRINGALCTFTNIIHIKFIQFKAYINKNTLKWRYSSVAKSFISDSPLNQQAQALQFTYLSYQSQFYVGRGVVKIFVACLDLLIQIINFLLLGCIFLVQLTNPRLHCNLVLNIFKTR